MSSTVKSSQLNTQFKELEDLTLRHLVSQPRQAQKKNSPAKKRKILFVTSEYAHLVKAGGLGDVSAALPKAMTDLHDIRILIPGYKQVIESGHLIRVIDKIESHAGLPACEIGRMRIKNGPIIYVVLCPELYEREGTPYADAAGKDWQDNHIRFARLSLAAAEIARGRNTLAWQPELIHAHDWPTALVPAYLKWQSQKTPSIFTIHNLAHQGLFEPECSPALDLSPEAFNIESMEFYGKLSFLKAGLVYASHITTVSQTYAREITQPNFGCGLEGLLKLKFEQGLLSGITNGIDETWEPRTDSALIKNFAAHQWQNKHVNSRYVENLFGLTHSTKPIFSVVSRLAHQKGLDLTLKIAPTIIAAGGRLVVMGSGDTNIEAELISLAQQHPQQIGVHIGFNETDARRIFAGSDFLLMPSRFEPCGLSQMYAQGFASLPIARRTGGLADTIEDGINGFLFNDATVESYSAALQRALSVFNHTDLLNAMRCHAMKSPRLWKQSVQAYDYLYRRLLGEVRTNNTVSLEQWRNK